MRRNKYQVAPAADRTWQGRTYASKTEMLYAQQLDLLRQAGEVREVICQPRVTLVDGFDYRPDFLVVERERTYYVDVKGAETQRFRDAARLWARHGRLPLVVVKRKGSRFVVDRTIEANSNGGGNGHL